MSDREHADVERRVEDALHSYTEGIDPAPDAWATLQGRIERRRWWLRWQRPLFASGAIALAAAAIVTVLLVTRDGDTPGEKVEVGPAASTTPAVTSGPPPTTAVPPTTTATTPPPIPADSFVALRRSDGIVVVLDGSGERVRELVDTSPYGRAGEIALDPGGTTLWFTAIEDMTGCSSLYRVPTAGGAVEEVATAATFALSPDGTRFAAGNTTGVTASPQCAPAPGATVAVYDVGGGEPRMWWEYGDPELIGPAGPTALAWSPDGARLAVTLCFEDCVTEVVTVPGGGRGAVGVLTDGVALDADGSVTAAAWAGGDSLVAGVTCCYPEDAETPYLASFGAGDGILQQRLLDVPSRVSSILGFGDGEYFLVDADGRLLHVAAGGTRELATDIQAAVMAPPPGPPGDLPAAVASTASTVVIAAQGQDWEALRGLMDARFTGPGFVNGPDRALDAIRTAQESGRDLLGALARALTSAPAERDGFYVFTDPSGTDHYRAVVTTDGGWTAFVAGD
jgi:hypothetical protein